MLGAKAYRGFSVTHPPSKALKAGRLTKNDDFILIKTKLNLKQQRFKYKSRSLNALYSSLKKAHSLCL
jgi:hypothetical protein